MSVYGIASHGPSLRVQRGNLAEVCAPGAARPTNQPRIRVWICCFVAPIVLACSPLLEPASRSYAGRAQRGIASRRVELTPRHPAPTTLTTPRSQVKSSRCELRKRRRVLRSYDGLAHPTRRPYAERRALRPRRGCAATPGADCELELLVAPAPPLRRRACWVCLRRWRARQTRCGRRAASPGPRRAINCLS